jgi:RNA polymerase sigma factor (sigma-70 family)
MRMPSLPNATPLAGLALRCQPDSRLVELSREGHARAFEEIVRRYRGPLVSFAGRVVPADRAEDVVQEALAKAHTTLVGSGTEIRQLRPWLYTVVRNGALNDQRDEPADERLDEAFDGVLQPPEVAVQREELVALTARLKELPRAQREALVQRELEGRSHREIGTALGLSPGAVRGLIFRARTALRDGVGMLIPMPVLRALLNAGPFGAEAAGAGIGGAAASLTAGGGAGVAAKAGTTLAVAALAIGSGAVIQNRAGDGNGGRAGALSTSGDVGADAGAGSPVGSSGPGSLGSSGHGSGPGSRSGLGGGSDSGHGSDDSGDSRDSSGSGGGHDGTENAEEDAAEAAEASEGHGGSGSSGSDSGSGSSDSGRSSGSSGPG